MPAWPLVPDGVTINLSLFTEPRCVGVDSSEILDLVPLGSGVDCIVWGGHLDIRLLAPADLRVGVRVDFLNGVGVAWSSLVELGVPL